MYVCSESVMVCFTVSGAEPGSDSPTSLSSITSSTTSIQSAALLLSDTLCVPKPNDLSKGIWDHQ